MYNYSVLDRLSKGKAAIEALIEALQCCRNFLSILPPKKHLCKACKLKKSGEARGMACLRTKAKFRHRANHEPFSFHTIDSEAASFEVIKNGSWKVRRLN